jgi:DNA-binding response OmpR family regulator
MTTILVVEDARIIAELLKETFEVEGYHTVTVLNGEEAVQFALRETPQLIILDIMLPGMNGYEVIKQLREHPKTMNIPIVVLSACTSHAEKICAFELGVDNYLTKPFDTEELLALVRRQIRRAQQGSLSPLTQLPGGLQIEHALHAKLASSDQWSLLYLDLDNFKAFNDVYGFLAGNEMILLVGQACQRMVYEFGNSTDFVGHIGGDDFLVMTTPDKAELLCQKILSYFKQQSSLLYRPEDLERGSISGVDRKGRAYQFPLASLSIGVVNNRSRYPHSVNEIGLLVANAKRHAKQSSNNVYSISSHHIIRQPDVVRTDSVERHPVFVPLNMQVSGQRAFHFMEHDAYAEF